MKYIVILDPGVASRESPGTYPPYDEGLKANIFIKNASNLPLEGKVCNGTFFILSRQVFPLSIMPYVQGLEFRRWYRISGLHEPQ